MVQPTNPGAIGAPRKRVGKRTRSGQITSRWTPVVFLALPLALYLMWVIGPLIYSFYMSLTNADGVTQQDWVGLRNYERLWNDPMARTAFWNNVRWLLAFILIPTTAGLGLAVLLNRDVPGIRFIKAGIFSPMVLSTVVIAQVWSWMYFPNDGLINSTLGTLGIDFSVAWLGSKDFSFFGIQEPTVSWSIIFAGVWRQIGYVMLLYLAGLKNVDTTLVDAAKVDGASAFQSFRDVVFPLLQPVTVIVVVVSIIDALRSFDLVNLMTDGGPYGKSSVLSHRMYEEAFNNYRMGYAAAIAVVLMLISVVFIFTYLLRMVREEMEY